MSEPTQQQKCADLARKMFPTAEIEPSSAGHGVDIRIYDKPNETRSWYDFNPYKSADDKDALLAWLAADDARWFVFIRKLIKLINWPSQSPQEMTDATFPKIVSEVKHLMTAPLPVIADAAWLAIQVDASPPPA